MRNLLFLMMISIAFISAGFVIAQIPTQSLTNSMQAKQRSNVQPYSSLVAYTNNTKVVIPSVAISNDNGPNIQASGIELTNTSKINSDTDNHVAFNLVIQSLTVSNTPLQNIGPIQISTAHNNFNLRVLGQLRKVSQTLNNNCVTQDVQQEAINEAYQLIPQIITPTSKSTSNLSINTQQGAFTFYNVIDWPSTIPLPKSIDDIILNIHIIANFKVANALLEKLINSIPSKMPNSVGNNLTGSMNMTPNQNPILSFLDGWVKQGYVIKTASDYTISITLDKGILKINGKRTAFSVQSLIPLIKPSGPLSNVKSSGSPTLNLQSGTMPLINIQPDIVNPANNNSTK